MTKFLPRTKIPERAVQPSEQPAQVEKHVPGKKIRDRNDHSKNDAYHNYCISSRDSPDNFVVRFVVFLLLQAGQKRWLSRRKWL